MNRAVRGEQRAVRLLEHAGWEVVDSQVGQTWSVGVGADTVEVDLRADHIVRQAGRSCVAEVKTGQEAPSVSTAATRRQLLEYRVAFDVDGVLLVDIERETVRRVHFGL
jgi:Holliday junction resolvase-like predicted endonuclease